MAAAAGMRFPLASTAAPRASSTRSDTQQQQQPEQWTIGQLVSIAPRTGPGMNQPGGIAHITGIETTNATVPSLSISTANIAATATATATSITTISVKYVVDGRHERRVPTDCVRPHAWRSTLRDRTLLLGRCGTCGSLRSDCGGSCAATTTRRDFGFYHKTNHAMNNNTSRTNAIRHNPYNGDGGADRVWLDKENSTESQQRTHHGRQRHKQETFKSNSIRGTNWNSDSDEDEEEDNSDDEDFSQECPSRGRRKTTRGSKHQRRRHNNDWATMLKHNRLKAQAERFYAQENLEPVSTKNHGPAVDAAAAVANTNSKSKEEEYNSNDNSNYEDYPLLSLKSTDNASVCTNLNGVAKNPRMRQRLVRRQNRNHIAGKSVLECGVSSSSSTNNTNNSDSSSTSRSAPKRKAGNSTVWKPPPKGVAAAPPPLRSSSQSPHSQEPVSNPGSPDTDLEDRSSLFAGNVWQSHSPAPSSSTTIWSNNNDSSEDHDASVYSSGEDFIQPEGNAQELPLDIVDETKGLDYPAVLSFFDDTMLRLRTKDLPLGQRKVAALESEWVRFPETLQQEDQQRLAKTRKDHLHQKR